jgi:hypothetical protein
MMGRTDWLEESDEKSEESEESEEEPTRHSARLNAHSDDYY